MGGRKGNRLASPSSDGRPMATAGPHDPTPLSSSLAGLVT